MGFCNDLKDRPVMDLPVRDVILLPSSTVIRAAVAMMRNHSLGCAVIVDQGQIPIGIFTEHSIIEILLSGASLDESPVSHYADASFVEARQSDSVWHVWEACRRSAARFVCVTDQEGKAIGLTGQRGLAEYLCDYFANEVTTQRLGSTPWMGQREGA